MRITIRKLAAVLIALVLLIIAVIWNDVPNPLQFFMAGALWMVIPLFLIWCPEIGLQTSGRFSRETPPILVEILGWILMFVPFVFHWLGLLPARR